MKYAKFERDSLVGEFELTVNKAVLFCFRFITHIDIFVMHFIRSVVGKIFQFQSVVFL